jgi:hypothetical protein
MRENYNSVAKCRQNAAFRRDTTDDLLATLARIRPDGLQIVMKAGAVPSIGLAHDEPPFDAIQCNDFLMEVFGWR